MPVEAMTSILSCTVAIRLSLLESCDCRIDHRSQTRRGGVMECVLAIDQGTTGSRAALYGRDGARVASAYREFTQLFPVSGWVEHDPDEIWQGVTACVSEVLSQAPAAEVACVGITNQRETAVAWDAETSRPLHNAIVWQCRRTALRCQQLNLLESTAHEVRRITGLPIDAYFSATKFEWLLQHSAEVRAAARRGTLRLGTVDSWLLWKLTGGSAHVTDHTNAARTMLFDIDRLCWHEELLALFEVPIGALPEVRRSAGHFGATRSACGLPSGVPISGVAGDQQAALFGQACFAAGRAKNTYGTGAFVLMNAGRRRPVDDTRLITTLGCGESGEPVYVLEGAIFTAGAVLQWLRDGLGLIASAAESASLAESVDDNGGVYFVPALSGLGAPYWDSMARGMICGITRGTRREHVVRAALEAMCFRTRDVVEAMACTAAVRLTELRVDGGASANDFMCQFQSDILGVRVLRPRDVETTARGAAYLAGLGSGYWDSVAQLESVLSIERVFEPSMLEARRSELYAWWLRAVERALGD